MLAARKTRRPYVCTYSNPDQTLTDRDYKRVITTPSTTSRLRNLALRAGKPEQAEYFGKPERSAGTIIARMG